jgi:carboxypeptidase PM20D1
MRRVVRAAALAVGVAILMLVAVLVVRTSRYASGIVTPPIRQQARDARAPVDSAAIGRLSGAVRIPTVTYFDSTPRLAQFRKLHAFLERSFPLVHAKMQREVLDSGTLVFTWRGSDTALAPAMFMGHQDVVPVEPGTEQDWKQPAFSGEVTGGEIWGRGTLDDKLSVLGLLEGAEALLKRGVEPRRTALFVFGHTEEGGGPSADRTARLFESRGIRPWFVMDEGGALGDAIVPGVSGKVALVGIAEKGYLTLWLSAKAAGGHSSMPARENAVTIVSAAVGRLQATRQPARLNDATRATFATVGPHMSYGNRLVMANLWLFEPVLLRAMARSPSSDAVIRTTTAPTMLAAGIKDNVVPQSATATVNFRLLPGDSVSHVIARVKQIIADERVDVQIANGMAFDATRVSPYETDAFRLIGDAIRHVYPDAIVSPYMVMGGTDARHFYRITPNVYRFAPIVVEDGTLSLVHGTNERIGVDHYLDAVRLYTHLIERAVR